MRLQTQRFWHNYLIFAVYSSYLRDELRWQTRRFWQNYLIFAVYSSYLREDLQLESKRFWHNNLIFAVYSSYLREDLRLQTELFSYSQYIALIWEKTCEYKLNDFDIRSILLLFERRGAITNSAILIFAVYSSYLREELRLETQRF